MVLDLSNWSEYDPNQNNIGREYSRVTRLPIGEKSEKEKQKLRIVTDIKTGDYKVLAIGKKKDVGQDDKDILIYSYDADKNKVTINDTKKGDRYYDLIFGSKSGQKEFKKLNRDTRLNTYNLAKENVETKNQQRNFELLGDKKGYKSAVNQANVPPQTIISPITRTQQSKSLDSPTGDQGFIINFSSPVTRHSPNTDLGSSSNEPDQILKPDESSPNSESSKSSGKKNSGSFNYMRYPEGRIPSLGYDYIQITAYNYQPVGLPESYGEARKRNNDTLYQNPKDVIQLPMIGSISETSAVQWSDDTVSEIQNIAAGIAMNTITGAGNPFKAVASAFTDAMKSGKEALQDKNIQIALSAYFAGQAAGVPNVLQRSQGRMINNNLELLFNGPTLRSFNFAFQLRPRTKSEAELCRQIIRSLKKSSAPKITDDYMFLTTPDIYKIQYIYNSGGDSLERNKASSNQREHPYMNKIKPCALTGLTVNYTPDGSYMTYEDGGSMTGYDLSLSFKEIEPVYQKDQENAGSDNMGY